MPTLQTKIKRTEQRIADLQFHLANLKARLTGNAITQSIPKEFRSSGPPSPHAIVFDGGTSCNIPSRGYGRGYGSYKIGMGDVKRVEFGIGHSCNSAEIMTLVMALREWLSEHRGSSVTIYGDSKIALKWANPNLKEEPKQKTSEKFKEAVALLRNEIRHFSTVSTRWRPRTESVRLFGH